MSKFLVIILLIFLFSLFQLTYELKNIMILEGDSLDKAIQDSIEEKSKLLLIFYVNHCPYCAHSIKVLKEQIIKNFEDEEEINFGTINLDRQSNVWVGVRFNITRIPYIVLIENKKMYQFQSQFEESVVLKFIHDEKTIEDAIDIPDNVGWKIKSNIIMQELTERLKNFMQSLLNKYGIKVQWNNTMTYIFLFFIMICIIYLENKLILLIKNLCKFDRIGNIKIDLENKENNNKIKKEKKDKKNEKNDNEKGKIKKHKKE